MLFSKFDVSLLHLLSHSWNISVTRSIIRYSGFQNYIISLIIIIRILRVVELIIFYWYSEIANFEDVIMCFEANSCGISNGILSSNRYTHLDPRMRLLRTTMKIFSKLSLESYLKLFRLIHFKDLHYLIGLIFIDFFITNMDIFFLYF